MDSQKTYLYRPFYWAIIRLAIYSLLVLTITQITHLETIMGLMVDNIHVFPMTEFSKCMILLFLSGLYMTLHLKNERFKILSFMLFGMVMALFFFDQRVYFDRWLYSGSYKLFSYVSIFAAVYMAVTNRNSLLACFGPYSRSFAFGLLMYSILTIWVFTGPFGLKLFFPQNAAANNIVDFQKGQIEYSGFFGYTLLLISGIEYAVFIRPVKHRPLTRIIYPNARQFVKNMRYNIFAFMGVLLLKATFKTNKRKCFIWW